MKASFSTPSPDSQFLTQNESGISKIFSLIINQESRILDVGEDTVDTHEELVERLLEHYSADESVLGIILVGSAGKGYDDEESDIDLEIIVAEDKYNALEKKTQRFIHAEDYDLVFTTIAKLQQFRESKKDEDHWRYQGCPVLLDKTGKLDGILKEIEKYDLDSRLERLKRYYLGYWQNSLHSVGCVRHENKWGAKIYAALAMRDLIRLLFNLNYRWAPELQWAFKEIHSLKGKPPNLEPKIQDFLARPDSEKFSRLWEETAKMLREENHPWVDQPELIL